MELSERDIQVLEEISRWRYLLGRHIQVFCNFPSESTTYRRLRKLVDGKYLKAEHVLYGYPAIYTVAHKGRILIGANKREDKINLALIAHNVAVLDTVVYYLKRGSFSLNDLLTEKELHIQDGFNNRRHHPDYVITKKSKGEVKTVAYEVELSLKAVGRLIKNIEYNFINYNKQVWAIKKQGTKIDTVLREQKKFYPNIKIVYLAEILNS